MPSWWDTDLHVNGTFSANNMAIPANAVGDAQVAAGIGAQKLGHEHSRTRSQASGVNNATTTEVIFVARNAGTVVRFGAGHQAVATGTGNTTIDLHKNGVSILNAVITLTNQAVNTLVTAALGAGAVYAANDVFKVIIVATPGTGIAGQGVFSDFRARELGT